MPDTDTDADRPEVETVTNAADLSEPPSPERVEAPDFPVVTDRNFEELVINSTGIVVAWSIPRCTRLIRKRRK